MAYWVDAEGMRRLAARLGDVADAVERLGREVGVALEEGGIGAAGVSGTLGVVGAWAGHNAGDVRRRIGILQSGGPEIGAELFAPPLDAVPGSGVGATTPGAAAFWNLAFTMCPTPAAVAGLFAGMAHGEARSVVARWPEAVGPMGGAPLHLRFAANRILIRRELARVRRLLGSDRLPYGGPGVMTSLWREEAVLESFLDRDFLLFDWTGDGRIAEWHGPLDAAHITVSVPGTGASKSTFNSLAERSETMLRHDPTGDLAVVTALVFDAPANLLSAVRGGPARRAAPLLADFLAVLPRRGRHLTVLAHSYGSTVLGHAFGHGLGDVLADDDDVIVIGSPGMGMDSVDEMPHPSRHVWAALTDGDEIRWAVDPVAVLAEAVCAPAVFDPYLHTRPFAEGACPSAEGRLIHGRDPTSAEYGARRFATGPNLPPDHWWRATEHGEYWATLDLPDGTEIPSEALANILSIATGRYEEVT